MGEILTAEEFYRLRDDRTNRYIGSSNFNYQKIRIRITSSEKTVSNFSGQVQLIIAANMLARWCRWIDFTFPDAPLSNRLKINGWTTLHERIGAEVKQADPFGRFEFMRESMEEVQYVLAIGKVGNNGKVNFSTDADGWNVWAGRHDRIPVIPHLELNPVGPAFAACIGVADAFKVATGQPDTTRVHNLAFSLLSFSTDTASDATSVMPLMLNIGNAQMIGVGSVGSAATYLLHMIPIKGSLSLIDHDPVEIGNLNRSPLFGINMVGKPKVAVAAEYLDGYIRADPFVGLYQEYINSRGRKRGDLDLVLPFANEYGVRYQIENNLPPMQIYATTTKSWGINYHRHIPFREDCSVCRFPEINAQVNFICSTTEIQSAIVKPVDAALPFLSLGAAVLAVGDLIKLHLPSYPFTPNFAFIDFKDKMETILAYQRKPQKGCICTNRSISIHNEYINSTRYFNLSRPVSLSKKT